ncbi:hypothetical protein [Urbifossiella limnaea]|nr:hypothetical protein [Urbifossiella limnaea]
MVSLRVREASPDRALIPDPARRVNPDRTGKRGKLRRSSGSKR